MSDCRLNENLRIHGVPGISLENEQLRVVVLVGKGTDILEFRHKPSDVDVLVQDSLGVEESSNLRPRHPRSSRAVHGFLSRRMAGTVSKRRQQLRLQGR